MTTITQINGGTDNCYVVADGGKAILIDTASGAYLDKELRYIRLKFF